MAQELTCRIAVVTGKGQTELIKEHFGSRWATFAVICPSPTHVRKLIAISYSLMDVYVQA